MHIVKIFPSSGMTVAFRALPPLQNSKANSLSGGVTQEWELFAILDRNRRLSRNMHTMNH